MDSDKNYVSKLTLVESKEFPDEFLPTYGSSDDICMPQDLSLHAKNEFSIREVCKNEYSNIHTAAGICRHKADSNEISTQDNIGVLESTDVVNQFKHFLNLYQLQLQKLKQHQRSPVCNSSPTATPVVNNMMPYLSFLLAASSISLLQSPQLHCANFAAADVDYAAIAALSTASARADVNHTRHSNEPTSTDRGVLTSEGLLPTALRPKGERSTPNGYIKYRFSEDCGFEKCGYRQRQSHFHCSRVDCYYSFCDKTRFVQHTARHDRLDTLMGNDFQQFRANMQCAYTDCAYQLNAKSVPTKSSKCSVAKKSSHFHCLKCVFTCSDTNKVVAHRRHHSKVEYIRLAGFSKVLSVENCYHLPNEVRSGRNGTGLTTSKTAPVEYSRTGDEFPAATNSCAYNLKQTHYHCLLCGCGILSRTQLAAHRQKSCNTALNKTAAVAHTGTADGATTTP
ncbi:uncharacterized protein LOC118745825 [Rhagoletis pomonella]|uniref:uncharacterized protein LOC118745825 n=1 Tax=Rhagoletis pomonella TaxID=28610 RepID=UPI00177F3537|nr:uncharacterized protein LOC118745825 [Rhagoletis pomonella]